MLVTRSQRWRERRSLYLADRETVRPQDYDVRPIEEREARDFVRYHHYSGTFPAARLSVGLFAAGGSALKGVAVFSVPMNQAVTPKHTGLVEPRAAAELGRLVLLDDVPQNGESHFVSRAFRCLRAEKPEILAVVSYADPTPRFGDGGTLLKPGHIGQAYQALSASLRGRTLPRYQYILPKGQIVSERALAKIRAQDQGHRYAAAQLAAGGVEPRRAHEDPRAWLRRILAEGQIQRRLGAGKYVYAWPLTLAARLAARDLPTLPYPRLGDPLAVDVSALPLFATS
ncbi:MAG: Mom family adenine methylcarbamoylation protein [Brevundimonas aurantiaca]|uniref:Mom family adenine methylcarbamoylation protein n=1 Tax=Brevundimonas aurantiaca TaxID=74316 RepID=UPI004034BB7C